MNTQKLTIGTKQAIYYKSSEVFIHGIDDILDLIGNSQTDYLILHAHNFEQDYFDLSTRKLGDALQKLTNYRIQLAIIGDFNIYPSKVLKDFISESNRHKKYVFVSSIEEVKNIWSE